MASALFCRARGNRLPTQSSNEEIQRTTLMQARLFHLHALSALHCGTGQSMGVVDIPIARARATNLPMVPGSSLRGVLRHQIAGSDPNTAKILFGPETIASDSNSFAGAFSIGDASLLVLPVRCLAGIVSFVTAPFILRRYVRDLARAGPAPPPLPREPAANEATVIRGSANLVNGKLVLEDLDLTAREDYALKEWAERIAQTVYPNPDDTESRRDFVVRFTVLPDTVMDFLAETATEIRARIALNPSTGTVKKGALWYEENLPAESLLWGIFAMSDSNYREDPRSLTDLLKSIPSSDTLLQLGGKAGVGRGLVRFTVEDDQ